MKETVLAAAAIATAFAMASSADNHEDMVKDTGKKMEKCAGTFIAVGKNDCAHLLGKHTCSGQSTERSPHEWIYMPKGLCDKIADGRVVD